MLRLFAFVSGQELQRVFDQDHWEDLASTLEDESPISILKKTLTLAKSEGITKVSIAFSGAEDVVLIALARPICKKLDIDLDVFCLDTGRLHPETYQFIEAVRKHFDISIRLMAPDTAALQQFVQEKGLFSFFEDGHQECCKIRKVEPLGRAISSSQLWMTGQRKDQSATRTELPIIQMENDGTRIKCNPLANWSRSDVWSYISISEIPFNVLHQQGFVSIGCQPCTRPTLPEQHEREGRWWWENEAHKECGIHIVNK